MMCAITRSVGDPIALLEQEGAKMIRYRRQWFMMRLGRS